MNTTTTNTTTTTNEPMKYQYQYQRDPIRAYLPDQVPEDLRERLCQQEAESIDADCLSESLECWQGEELKSAGIEGYKVEGWDLYGQGSGVALSFQVLDLEKLLGSEPFVSALSADARRLILGADREEGLILRAEPRGGYYPGTVSDCTLENPHARYVPEIRTGTTDDGRFPVYGFDPAHPQAEAAKRMDDALAELESAWEEFVSDQESKAHRALEADYESQISWDAIEERLRDYGEMVLADGNVVDAGDCTEVQREGDSE